MRISLIILVSLLLSGCVKFKTARLFDLPPDKKEPANIDGFYALDILHDKESAVAWYSPETHCIEFKATTEDKYSGPNAIHAKWDKQKGGCDWIGMGVGWNGWASKNLSGIMDKAAVQFKVLSKGDKIKALPLAIAFEDYGESEAWVGVFSKYISYKNNENWATVQIPIADFDWMQFEADPSNVKQLKLQFEASGDYIFDEFKVVEIESSRNRVYNTLYTDKAAITVDGKQNEAIWKDVPTLSVGNSVVQIVSTDKSLLISGRIWDQTPMLTKGNIKDRNSDGVELIFSTNPKAYNRRKNPLYSDQHFIFGVQKDPKVWDVRKNKLAEQVIYKIDTKSKDSYSFEAKIPLKYLEVNSLASDVNYDLQIVVNNLDKDSKIIRQIWNGSSSNYSTDPSTWGQIKYSKSKIGIPQ